MFTYFFTYQTELPPNTGFRLFGAEHLLWLAGIGLFLFLSGLIFLQLSDNRRECVLNLTVLLALFAALGKDVILTVIGRMNVRMLPLHLCDLAAFVLLIQRLMYLRELYSLRSVRGPIYNPEREPLRFSAVLGEIGVCLLMPGAVLGVLFPVWTAYPALSFMALHGFLYHTLIILYPLLLFLDRQIRPRFSRFWYSVAFLCCIVPPVLWFDRRFDSNYMYLRHAPAGTPLWLLEQRMGYPGYLWGYAVAILLMILGIHALFSLYARRRG